ncbi:hypothetical protein RN001_012720 [Aquatica leii]|uniref:HAT C-terminal dimerisation domain-containing protein n=1 Tax=Aquatica leii TaxID=1421715 RepID=A0AAN7SMK7_9COLE|nr:hypothetical protein RN001_012720 [Aquatica leii]
MKAKYREVQTRIKNVNKRAMFMACVAHNLNLLLGDMAKCNKDAMTFFGLVQRLHTLFVASTERWNILCELCPGLTLKSLSSTRWECRIDSVKPIRYQLGGVNQALAKVSQTTKEPVIRSEAQSLLLHTSSYEFVLSLVIWYDLLFCVNSTSQTLESESTTLDTVLNELRGLKSFFQNYRNTDFNGAMCTAREIMENLGYRVKFSIRRQFTPKRLFDEKRQENDQREKQLEDNCQKLSDFLKDGELKDLNAEDLFSELKLFRSTVQPSVTNTLGALQYLAPIKESYSYLTTAYRIMLTIPLTVASEERTFSILKLIKNYHRSTMAQERLNGLATLSIECETAKKLDMINLISAFAFAKARKVPFK